MRYVSHYTHIAKENESLSGLFCPSFRMYQFYAQKIWVLPQTSTTKSFARKCAFVEILKFSNLTNYEKCPKMPQNIHSVQL